MKLSLRPLLCVLWPVDGFYSSKTLHHRDDEVVVVVEEGREEGGGIVVNGGNCDRFGVMQNFTRRLTQRVCTDKKTSAEIMSFPNLLTQSIVFSALEASYIRLVINPLRFLS